MPSICCPLRCGLYTHSGSQSWPGYATAGRHMRWYNTCDFLANKGDLQTGIPVNRFDIDAYCGTYGKHSTVFTKHDHVLNEIDNTHFDHFMFYLGCWG